MDLVINDIVAAAAFTGFNENDFTTKEYKWRTEVVEYDTALEQRNQVWSRPLRTWKINWYLLDTNARNALINIFNRARGMYEVFKFYDFEDYAATYTECSIVATGGETTTQLKKRYNVGTSEYHEEKKTRIIPGTLYAPTIKIDDGIKTEGTHFTLNDETGVIDWTGGTAPNGALTTGEIVTADFQFYFPVRFWSDTWTDKKVYPGLFDASSLVLIEVIE